MRVQTIITCSIAVVDALLPFSQDSIIVGLEVQWGTQQVQASQTCDWR